MSLPTSSLASPPPLEPMRRLHVVSPADYNERCQNALKLIQMKGMPDFVTMTCNPQWPEIRGADACDQWSSDRIAVHASNLPRPQDRVVPGYSRTSPDALCLVQTHPSSLCTRRTSRGAGPGGAGVLAGQSGRPLPGPDAPVDPVFILVRHP